MKLIPPKKIRIFSYKTFTSSLLLETKGLEIVFNQTEINLELLFELESILSWCTTHLEVETIVLKTKFDTFLTGFDYENFKNLDDEKILKLNARLNKINKAIATLPQTVVADLKNGASNEGLSIAISSDIRISDSNARFKFDQIAYGLMDFSGILEISFGSLNTKVLKSYFLSGHTFGLNELNLIGANSFTDISLDELTKNLHKNSNIARAQIKCAFMTYEQNDQNKEDIFSKLYFALLDSKDYTKPTNFVGLREYKEALHDTQAKQSELDH